MSDIPAGWYPDTEQPGNERWWDGTAWTEARRPVVATQPAPGPVLTAPIAGALAAPAPATPVWKRPWFIIVGAIVVLAIIGSVSGAIAAANKTTPASDVVAVDSPSPAPTPLAAQSATPSDDPAPAAG